MRGSLHNLREPKVTIGVTLLVTEAGGRGRGDRREGKGRLKVLGAGIADAGSNVWALSIWERKPVPLRA